MSADLGNQDRARAESHGYEVEPSSVSHESGKIIIDGPDGVAVTMSPEAAEETARRLVAAVGQLRGESEDDPPAGH